MALAVARPLPRLLPCPLHWDRVGGPLGYIMIPRAILAKCQRPIAETIRTADRCLPPIERGDVLVIDAANTDPGTGQLIACTLNGRALVRVYHRAGNHRVTLRLALHERDEQIAVRRADTLVIHGVAVGVVCGRSGRAWLLTTDEPIAC